MQLGNSGIAISPLIYGTWQTGKIMWSDINDNDSIEAITIAYENGITTFDTALVYGDGHAEKILGNTVKSYRDKVVITSKVFSDQLHYDQVISSCHRSLKNLQTEYIDLFQIHFPSTFMGGEAVPLEETMDAMNELQAQGKIRAIGVSNFSLQDMQQVVKYGNIVSLQPPYSLFWRYADKHVREFCEQHTISLLAYSPLANGVLTGKFGIGHQFNIKDNRQYSKLTQADIMPLVVAVLDELKPIAEKYDTTLTNLALAWVMAQNNTAAIMGVRNAEQAKQNVAAMHLKLDSCDLQLMETIAKPIADQFIDDPYTHFYEKSLQLLKN